MIHMHDPSQSGFKVWTWLYVAGKMWTCADIIEEQSQSKGNVPWITEHLQSQVAVGSQ